ncbi:hypothetical protein PUN28_020723 [Cardiocondyla obscurior]|uniref:Uncharacterized protein n=1 Tax=Cardiocondyla obscurior TaxID=286306 RepID=A0AAW2EAE6_9HYME
MSQDDCCDLYLIPQIIPPLVYSVIPESPDSSPSYSPTLPISPILPTLSTNKTFHDGNDNTSASEQNTDIPSSPQNSNTYMQLLDRIALQYGHPPTVPIMLLEPCIFPKCCKSMSLRLNLR